MSKSPAADLPLAIERRAAAEDAAIGIGSFDAATNTIEVCFSTGAKVRRYDWRSGQYYDEELVVSPNAVRTERLEAGAPLLNSHASYSLGAVLGAVVPGTVRFEGGKAYCRVKLSTADDVRDAVHKITEGSARNVSVGYAIHIVEKTETRDGEIPTWRVTDWEPYEISSVAIPADPGAQVRCANIPNSHDQNRQRAEGATMTTATTAEQTPASNDQTRAAVEAERTRSSTITTLAARHGLGDFGAEHVRAGTDIEAFRTALLDKLATEQLTERNHVIGPANADRRADAIASALLHRSAPGTFELSADAREFASRSLLELARDSLEVAGIRTLGMRRHEIAERALAGATRSGGMMGTSDFPMLLANVANRSLRRAYEAAPQTFRPLVSVTTLPDFKTVSRNQLGEAPAFERVNEQGEFKRGAIAEGREQYNLLTYGKVVAITRQAIINDDTSAFTRVPRMFGIQAANLESDLVWSQIVGNPTMGDNVALFHADHGNLGTAAAIAVDSIAAGREAMRLQKGLDARTILNLSPRFLIAPVAAQTKAEQLLTSITPAQTANAVPESIRRLELISEPRLDGGFVNPATGATVTGSRFHWFLAADPAMIDLVELGYLDGQQGVYTETRTGFDVDGVEVKVRLDVGAKALDWRGFWKNPATAL